MTTKPRLLNARHLKALPPNAKYIGRRHPRFPGLDYKWGNPYQVGIWRSLEKSLAQYRAHLVVSGLAIQRLELRGFDLV